MRSLLQSPPDERGKNRLALGRLNRMDTVTEGEVVRADYNWELEEVATKFAGCLV